MSNPSGLPDLVFVERDTATIEASMLSIVERELSKAADRTVTLTLADPRRAVVSAAVLLFAQAYQNINFAGRQNTQPYAIGDFLLAMGKLVLGDKADKLPASHAVSTERFTLSAARSSVTTIEAGYRLSAGGVLFETTEDVEIAIGDLTGDAKIQAVEAGTSGNDFVPGQINAMVNPIPFMASVTNLTKSQGGAPEESDDDYRERIRNAPNSFSVAGPEEAYAFWAKSASSAIADVSVITDASSPGVVTIVPLLAGGVIPGMEILDLVYEAVSPKNKRPQTDLVQTAAPEAVSYDVGITYWVDKRDAKKSATIQAGVAQAVDDYAAWQRAALGRDVNPDQLRAMVMAAGAKRLTVASPAFTALSGYQVAQEGALSVTYGGLEDA
jgi:phage-related baseplate assembly protein